MSGATLTAEGRAMFAAHPNSERCMREHQALLDRIRWSDQHAHLHGLTLGAYSLIPFIGKSGDFEYVWNSLNAYPRTHIDLSATGELATAIKLPIFAPDWTPRVGDQVMVKFTELRAKIVARERIEELRLKGGNAWDDFVDTCTRLKLSFEESVAVNATHIMDEKFSDVIHVTSGWVEQLETARRDGDFFSIHEIKNFPAFISHTVSVGALTAEEGEHVLRTVLESSVKTGTDIVLYEPRRVEELSSLGPLNEILQQCRNNASAHIAVRVALAVQVHAECKRIDFRVDQAVTQSPSQRGVKVLLMSSFWNAEVFICTTREGNRVGTQVMIVGPTWPKEHDWKGCAVHESNGEAIEYHESLCEMLTDVFGVKPDATGSVEEVIKMARRLRQ